MSLALILRIILILLIIRLVWRVVRRLTQAQGRPQPRVPGRAVPLVQDPICGTYLVPSRALSLTAADGIHYFCSEQCRRAYRARA